MRLPDEILQCVAFLAVKKTVAGVINFDFIGTAYFVSVPSEAKPEMLYGYLVTARHCVEGATKVGELHLRMNARDGSAKYIKLDAQWIFPSDPSVDLAVLPFAPDLSAWEYKYIPHTMLANQAKIAEHSIGIGDDIVISGLFANRTGKTRNNPIVRFGNLSAMPTERLPEDSGRGFHAYLVEVRSIGGLSGSPVFVYLGPARVSNNEIRLGQTVLLLLGIIRGHWHYTLNKSQLTAMSDDLRNVNLGIAVVTPATDLESVIMGADLVKARKQKDDEIRSLESAAIVQDAAQNLVRKES